MAYDRANQQKQAEPMSIDLIDMNSFVSEESQDSVGTIETKASEDTQEASSRVMHTDFLADDEVGLRDHFGASQVLNSQYKDEKPKINLVRNHEASHDFL